MPHPFALCSGQPRCLLSAAANSSSSSSATKRVSGQGASVQSTRVRCRRWRRRAPSTGPARPRCRPQSRTAPAAAPRRTRRRRSTLRAAVWRSKLRRRPSEPAAGVRHHAAAPRLREPYPVYARAPCARTVWTAPKHALRAGGRVELPPPPPPARGAAAPSSPVVPVISPVIAGRSSAKKQLLTHRSATRSQPFLQKIPGTVPAVFDRGTHA